MVGSKSSAPFLAFGRGGLIINTHTCRMWHHNKSKQETSPTAGRWVAFKRSLRKKTTVASASFHDRRLTSHVPATEIERQSMRTMYPGQVKITVHFVRPRLFVLLKESILVMSWRIKGFMKSLTDLRTSLQQRFPEWLLEPHEISSFQEKSPVGI